MPASSCRHYDEILVFYQLPVLTRKASHEIVVTGRTVLSFRNRFAKEPSTMSGIIVNPNNRLQQ